MGLIRFTGNNPSGNGRDGKTARYIRVSSPLRRTCLYYSSGSLLSVKGRDTRIVSFVFADTVEKVWTQLKY